RAPLLGADVRRRDRPGARHAARHHQEPDPSRPTAARRADGRARRLAGRAAEHPRQPRAVGRAAARVRARYRRLMPDFRSWFGGFTAEVVGAFAPSSPPRLRLLDGSTPEVVGAFAPSAATPGA